jgi:hypothetical protein
MHRYLRHVRFYGTTYEMIHLITLLCHTLLIRLPRGLWAVGRLPAPHPAQISLILASRLGKGKHSDSLG